jgi:zinc protease
MVRLRSTAITLSVACLLVTGAVPVRCLAMTPIQKMVLPNGLSLLLSEEHSLPFITCQLLMDTGSRNDPPGREGLSHITAQVLTLGTPGRSAEEISRELDFMGASVSASSGKDFGTVSLRVLKKNLDRGLDIFVETFTRPTFPEDEIKREIEKALAELRAQEDDPETVAQREFDKILYLSGPYGHDPLGTGLSLPGITREHVVSFHHTCYRPNGSVLAIVGDITLEEVKAKLVPRLSKWKEEKTLSGAPSLAFGRGPKTIAIDRSITQSNIILGNSGIARSDPDFYTLRVMNYILGGGGFSSRLTEEIRNKRGLAYSVASFFAAMKYPGSFEVVLQTKNASAKEAISIAVQQMERMQRELVPEKEIESAKKYLVGSFPLHLDTQAKLASFMTQVEYYGLGLDYFEKYPSLINRVTQEDVRRVAQTHLAPDKYILVIVGNLKEAGMEDSQAR